MENDDLHMGQSERNKMIRPNRVEYYRRICRKTGMEPKSSLGYFSRREMIELDSFLDAVTVKTVAKKSAKAARGNNASAKE